MLNVSIGANKFATLCLDEPPSLLERQFIVVTLKFTGVAVCVTGWRARGGQGDDAAVFRACPRRRKGFSNLGYECARLWERLLLEARFLRPYPKIITRQQHLQTATRRQSLKIRTRRIKRHPKVHPTIRQTTNRRRQLTEVPSSMPIVKYLGLFLRVENMLGAVSFVS